MGKITAPEPINTTHCLDDFDCGIQVMNQWLKRQALANEISGASRTFVVSVIQHVIGYYALATGSVRRVDAPGSIKRRMPDPIPSCELLLFQNRLESELSLSMPFPKMPKIFISVMVSRNLT
jgi:hypothetical protein